MTAGRESLRARPGVGIGSGQADPVLQAVDLCRRSDAVLEEQEPGQLGPEQGIATGPFFGPAQMYHVHDKQGRNSVLPGCFRGVNVVK